jgi:cytochrome c-type biogenesis protein CcmH
MLLFMSLATLAGFEINRFDTPEQEARYKTLVNELRCLVCQNQNLADSNAELAQDLRRQTYEMITKGSTDKEIVDYMVQRYGDFVLYRPPLKPSTVVLWAGPFLIFLFAVSAVIIFIRRRSRQAAPEISEEQKQQAWRLLQDKDDGQ